MVDDVWACKKAGKAIQSFRKEEDHIARDGGGNCKFIVSSVDTRRARWVSSQYSFLLYNKNLWSHFHVLHSVEA